MGENLLPSQPPPKKTSPSCFASLHFWHPNPDQPGLSASPCHGSLIVSPPCVDFRCASVSLSGRRAAKGSTHKNHTRHTHLQAGAIISTSSQGLRLNWLNAYGIWPTRNGGKTCDYMLNWGIKGHATLLNLTRHGIPTLYPRGSTNEIGKPRQCNIGTCAGPVFKMKANLLWLEQRDLPMRTARSKPQDYARFFGAKWLPACCDSFSKHTWTKVWAQVFVIAVR